VSGEAAGAVPDDVRAAVTEAVFRCTGADVGMLAYVSSAVLSVPAVAEAFATAARVRSLAARYDQDDVRNHTMTITCRELAALLRGDGE